MNVVGSAAIQTNEWQEVKWWFLVVQPSSPQSHPQGLINYSITMHTRALLHAHAHAGYIRLNKDIFIILSRFMMLLFLFICLLVCFLRLEVGGRTGH